MTGVARFRALAPFVVVAACGRIQFDTRTADAPPSTASLVQTANATSAQAGQLSATFSALPASGDLLVMVGAYPGSSLVSTSGGGATWTRAAISAMNANIELWYGVTDGTSSTITITSNDPTNEIRMSISEWTGLATTNAVDQAIATFGTNSPASAGGFTTGTTVDLVIFAASDREPNTFGAPTGASWTELDTATDTTYTETAWWTLAPPITTLAPDVTETFHHWEALLVAFRLAP